MRSKAVGLKFILAVSCLVPLMGARACSGSDQEKVAQAIDTALVGARDFQQTEIAIYNEGQSCPPDGSCLAISQEDHVFIQQELKTLAQAGQAAGHCVAASSNSAGDLACLKTVLDTVDEINNAGGLHIKSVDARKTYQTVMVSVRGGIAAIYAVLGG
jgi:hypothetical protein